MREDSIIIKGNRDGINAIINMNKFKDFQDMLDNLVERLSKGKMFYKGSTIKITTQLKHINDRDISKIKNVLFDEFFIKDCILEDREDKINKSFTGIHEGRTKFIKRTVRGGQTVNYSGNVVIIGDVNSGSEITAAGNIIVLGALHGRVHAGFGGNTKALVAAFYLQPEILRIGDIITISPDGDTKPNYPEVARVKGESIIVEPYLPNKYI